jgi:hypothetical protein
MCCRGERTGGNLDQRYTISQPAISGQQVLRVYECLSNVKAPLSLSKVVSKTSWPVVKCERGPSSNRRFRTGLARGQRVGTSGLLDATTTEIIDRVVSRALPYSLYYDKDVVTASLSDVCCLALAFSKLWTAATLSKTSGNCLVEIVIPIVGNQYFHGYSNICCRVPNRYHLKIVDTCLQEVFKYHLHAVSAECIRGS